MRGLPFFGGTVYVFFLYVAYFAKIYFRFQQIIFASEKIFLEQYRHTWTSRLRKFFIIKNTIPDDVEAVLATEERHIAEEIADYKILLKKWAELESEKIQNLGENNKEQEAAIALSKKRKEVLLGNLEKLSK